MGIFGKLKNVAVKAVYKVADPVITAIGAPVKTAKAILDPTKTVKQVSNEFFSQPKSTQAIKTTTNLLIVGGGTIAGATGKLGAVAKALIPTTIKGKIIGGTTALVAGGALISSPKARESVPEIIPGLINVGVNTGDFIEDPSLKKAKDIFVENPLLTGIIGGGALLATVPLIAPAIGNIITGEKLDDIEDAVLNNPNTMDPIFPVEKPLTNELPSSNTAIPTTNNMVPILATDKKKTGKRRATKKIQPSIRITNKLMNRNINKVVVHR